MSLALPPTAGQTVGPFFGYALPYDRDSELVPPGHPRAVRLYGRGHRRREAAGAGRAARALAACGEAEVSRAGSEGSLRRTVGRSPAGGVHPPTTLAAYTFTTLKPGAEPSKSRHSSPSRCSARGLPNRLFTRAYLPQDAGVLDVDPLLSSLPEPERATLMARADDGGFRFDIVLQGRGDGLPALPGTLRE